MEKLILVRGLNGQLGIRNKQNFIVRRKYNDNGGESITIFHPDFADGKIRVGCINHQYATYNPNWCEYINLCWEKQNA